MSDEFRQARLDLMARRREVLAAADAWYERLGVTMGEGPHYSREWTRLREAVKGMRQTRERVRRLAAGS